MIFQPRDVTLYVPAFNARRTLDACIDAIIHLEQRPAAIVIIDDGSTKPVQPQAGVRLIRHEANRGLAAARNTAINACDTPLIAGVDSDVVVDAHWLTELLAARNEHDVVGIGGRMDETYTDTLADRWRARHMTQHWGNEPVSNPRFLYGCNTLHNVEALRAVGGYDDRFRRSFDDVSISEALYEAGSRLLYWPSARCRHLRCDTASSVLRAFWSWHHPAGLLRGDYDNEAALCERIERVNFGIGAYRFDTDQRDGCNDLLWLDAAIPWVFAASDLEFAANRGVGMGAVKLLDLAPKLCQQSLLEVLQGNPPVSHQYAAQFITCLQQQNWEQRMSTGGWPRTLAAVPRNAAGSPQIA